MPFTLSTKGHYAVLLMYELARREGTFASLSEISAAQRVSQGYLEQIVKPLRESNLVISKVGFGGGYSLAKPSLDITVGEIIRAVEGPVIPVKCVGQDGDLETCPEDCRAKKVWERVGDAIDHVLDSITLHGLAKDP